MSADTVLLRLEGPLQSWGDNQSKFVVRRTVEAPTKSGVLGIICSAMGVSRAAARETLARLSELSMGVRIDRPGIRWWDYHTVGARIGVVKAAGGIKHTASTGEPETLVSRREYLCDASFLVALRGDARLIEDVAAALREPVWAPFLGRKSCPPSTPLLEGVGSFEGLDAALAAMPWRSRGRGGPDEPPDAGRVPCLVEWRATEGDPTVPPDAEVWQDVPVSFDPPVHEPRLVRQLDVTVPVGEPIAAPTPRPRRPRADYGNSRYRQARRRRLDADQGLCVFCKSPASTVQHVTYRRAGGGEPPEDLRSLCRLCHDAVTMIEYGLGMGMDRINPEEARWREAIIRKRCEIVEWRSLEVRRRRLNAEEVD